MREENTVYIRCQCSGCFITSTACARPVLAYSRKERKPNVDLSENESCTRDLPCAIFGTSPKLYIAREPAGGTYEGAAMSAQLSTVLVLVFCESVSFGQSCPQGTIRTSTSYGSYCAPASAYDGSNSQVACASSSDAAPTLPILDCPLADQTTDTKTLFKSGEALLKAGQPFGAYQRLAAAVQRDPANHKYSRKMQECGKAASLRAETIARTFSETKLKNAIAWFEAAVRYDNSNQAAVKGMSELRGRISAATESAKKIESSAREGNTENANTVLSTLSLYRGLIPEIDSAVREVRAVHTINSAVEEWSHKDRLGALNDIQTALEFASSSNTYVLSSAQQLRTSIADFLVSQAPTDGSRDNVVRGLQFADSALSVDPNNYTAKKLHERGTAALATFAFDDNRFSHTSYNTSASRVEIQTLRQYQKWLSSDPRFPSTLAKLQSNAYPAVHVRVDVDPSSSCGALDSATVSDTVRQALGNIAVLGDKGDVTFSLNKLNCALTDIPTQNVQSVNSTYVAGYTQLANPTYLQLENQLSSAQQQLNRAEYNNSVNPNFGTGFALGLARGQVIRLQRALASTPPYTNQEIIQQYQYQRFDSYRSYQIRAVLGLDDKTEHTTTEQDISGMYEARAAGVSGVLPQDKNGAANVQPTITSAEQCATMAWQDFKQKSVTALKELIATYFARRAMSNKMSVIDRAAAMLYLSEVMGGTRYSASSQDIQAYIDSLAQADENELASLHVPDLPVPKEEFATSADAEQESSEAVVARALESAVSIETDADRVGSGFFVTPACLVITNEHVISGAETIILRTSGKKLLTAQLVAKDKERDLALLQPNVRTCRPLDLENGGRVGQEVFAIGNPLGLSDTVTRGIVSALRQTDAGVHYVQIDAALNPGNSGGALISRRGTVIGVNTFGFKGAQGLNFAIAASEIRNAFRSYLR